MANNNIDGTLMKNALLDFEGVSAMIKENISGASKELLNESVREVMSKLITESDSEDDEKKETEPEQDNENEVQDTFSDNAEQAESNDEDSEQEDEEFNSESDADTSDSNEEESNDEEWGKFEKYKVGDREYDFQGANEQDLQGVYSILRNDDNIEVRQDGEDVYKVNNGEEEFIVIPTGSEPEGDDNNFEITLGDDDDDDNFGKDFDSDEDETSFSVELDSNECNPNETAENDVEDDDTETLNDENKDNVKESKIMSKNTMYTITLNEDDNLGYGMKQTKPAFTTPTDSSWDNGDTEEWDEGVPHGEDKPNVDRKVTPFEGGVKESRRAKYGRRMNEDVYGSFDNTEVWDELPADGGETATDEKEVTPFTDGIGGPLKEGRYKCNRARRQNLISKNGAEYGVQTDDENAGKHTSDAEVPVGKKGITAESIIRRTNKIMSENKALRNALNKFEKNLTEASVANVNLQNIVRLVTENTTSASEKKSIREQFAKCKSVKESNMLYNTIKESLNKTAHKNITESKQAQPISAKTTINEAVAPVNEKVIYKSNSLNESLDLMSRMRKIHL